MEASMTKLPFDKEEFDLIWSEGAIYIMGFRNGISSWKKLIKPGGYLVVSEISWFRKDIPSVLIKFWEDAYPEMDHIENKRKVIEKEGYILKGNFQLDRHAWLENYYKPLEQKVQAYLDKHKEKNEAFQVVDEFRSEVELYNKYNQYFGYVFYIMQKPL
jgi:SAM-dependent methyltransferase